MATCYFPSGNSTDDAGTYLPCNQTAVENGKHSSCCAPGDLCFTNGLCKADAKDQYNWNWRVGCTDPTFQDPACPNYCRDVGSDSGAHVVFQCQGNETWCCSTGNPDGFARNFNFTCCNKPDLVLQLGAAIAYTTAGVELAISTLSPLSSSTTTLSSTTLISSASSTTADGQTSTLASDTAFGSNPTSSPLASPAGTNTTALAVGLGVGIPLALIIIAAARFFCWRLGQRQNQRAHAQAKEAAASDSYDAAPQQVQHRTSVAQAKEIEGRDLPAEMGHYDAPAELDSEPRI